MIKTTDGCGLWISLKSVFLLKIRDTLNISPEPVEGNTDGWIDNIIEELNYSTCLCQVLVVNMDTSEIIVINFLQGSINKIIPCAIRLFDKKYIPDIRSHLKNGFVVNRDDTFNQDQ